MVNQDYCGELGARLVAIRMLAAKHNEEGQQARLRRSNQGVKEIQFEWQEGGLALARTIPSGRVEDRLGELSDKLRSIAGRSVREAQLRNLNRFNERGPLPGLLAKSASEEEREPRPRTTAPTPIQPVPTPRRSCTRLRRTHRRQDSTARGPQQTAAFVRRHRRAPPR